MAELGSAYSLLADTSQVKDARWPGDISHSFEGVTCKDTWVELLNFLTKKEWKSMCHIPGAVIHPDLVLKVLLPQAVNVGRHTAVQHIVNQIGLKCLEEETFNIK